MKIDGRYNNILGHIIPILQHLGDFLSLLNVYSFHTQIYGLQVDKTGKFCLHTVTMMDADQEDNKCGGQIEILKTISSTTCCSAK